MDTGLDALSVAGLGAEQEQVSQGAWCCEAVLLLHLLYPQHSSAGWMPPVRQRAQTHLCTINRLLAHPNCTLPVCTDVRYAGV